MSICYVKSSSTYGVSYRPSPRAYSPGHAADSAPVSPVPRPTVVAADDLAPVSAGPGSASPGSAAPPASGFFGVGDKLLFGDIKRFADRYSGGAKVGIYSVNNSAFQKALGLGI
jgi:hypothetical protein